MSEKRERLVTPIGEAKWAHLHTPKAPFEGKGSPKYQIDVYFDSNNAEWAAWAKDVMDKIRSLPTQCDKRTGQETPKQTPIKRELDETDQPTGRFYVTFKTSDRFKPGIFNVFGDQIPDNVLIGNGSKVRVSYVENVYSAFGGGINFYLNAVQVVELVEYKSQNAQAYGFDVEENPCTSPGEGEIPF